jgi:hypothetical protein
MGKRTKTRQYKQQEKGKTMTKPKTKNKRKAVRRGRIDKHYSANPVTQALNFCIEDADTVAATLRLARRHKTGWETALGVACIQSEGVADRIRKIGVTLGILEEPATTKNEPGDETQQTTEDDIHFDGLA